MLQIYIDRNLEQKIRKIRKIRKNIKSKSTIKIVSHNIET